MKPGVAAVLCSPETHRPLEIASEMGADGEVREVLLDPYSGRKFPIRDGIPIFLEDSQVTGLNKKYQKLYDRIAPFYDFPNRVYAYFKAGGEEQVRTTYLRKLEIGAGDKVLEVSIGTGANLRYLPPTAQYFGLDISWGMLKQCQKRLRKWGREAELFLGEAERLPFRDATFDVVLHVGGINFFNDKMLAVREMIRVAKPGMKLVIADETEDLAKSLEHVPVAGKFYRNREVIISAPVAMVPPEMQEVKLELLLGGRLYCLEFRKPR